MYFIIWRGWGFLVIPLTIVGALPGIAVAMGLKAIDAPASWTLVIAALVATCGGAAAIWYTAKALSSGPVRRLVDQNTGEQFVIRRDAGSLFFIPTRYWAYMVLVVGLLGTAFLTLGAFAPDSQATVETQSETAESL